MFLKRDSGATEIVSFAIVLAVLMFCITLYVFIAMPIAAENKELTHNDEILLEMADVKYGIDNLMISQMDNVVRMATLSLSPRGDKDMVSVLPELSNFLSSSTVVIEPGGVVPDSEYANYRQLKITFESKNAYAENVVIVYEGGEMSVYEGGKVSDKNKKVVLQRLNDGLSQSYYPIVPKSMEPLSMSGNEFAVMTYRIVTMKEYGGNTYGEFALTLRGFYNG